MDELKGKTAVISGGAEGLGLAMARELGGHGMNLVLADINAGQLAKAEQALQASGAAVHTVNLDAANLQQWETVAKEAVERFGKVHMLVNNAGVSGVTAAVDDTQDEDWRWVVDVNLMGVVNGARVMVPLMKAHGEGGWMINVASMAGFAGLPLASPYAATKAAVVALSESWRAELEPENIYVSVLCPGFVKTRIHESDRNKPDAYAADEKEPSEIARFMNEQLAQVVGSGMDSQVVGKRVVEAIAAKELYIFTHPNFRPVVKARFAQIDAAFERAAQSPLLQGDVVPDLPFQN